MNHLSKQALLSKILKPNATYYQRLGISKDAPATAIRQSYRSLCLLIHPDKFPHKLATDAFKAVHEAYSVLADAVKRSQYDRIAEAPQQTHYTPPSAPSATRSARKATSKKQAKAQAVIRRRNNFFQTPKEFVNAVMNCYTTFGMICVAVFLA